MPSFLVDKTGSASLNVINTQNCCITASLRVMSLPPIHCHHLPHGSFTRLLSQNNRLARKTSGYTTRNFPLVLFLVDLCVVFHPPSVFLLSPSLRSSTFPDSFSISILLIHLVISLSANFIILPPPPPPSLSHLVREDLKEFSKEFDKSEEDLKSLQSGVGQIVGEVLRQLTEDKCEWVGGASNPCSR